MSELLFIVYFTRQLHRPVGVIFRRFEICDRAMNLRETYQVGELDPGSVDLLRERKTVGIISDRFGNH